MIKLDDLIDINNFSVRSYEFLVECKFLKCVYILKILKIIFIKLMELIQGKLSKNSYVIVENKALELEVLLESTSDD